MYGTALAVLAFALRFRLFWCALVEEGVHVLIVLLTAVSHPA
jgi:hypothetical protein